MTNTFDHSETLKGCFICAQAYTIRGQIDICITDFGRGILKALSSADRYSYLSSSIEAIELAVREGVSSRPGPAAGLGLTHIQRFLEVNKGEMHILSGDGWVHWDFSDNGRVRKKQLGLAFDGTVVDIIARADGEGFYFLSSEKPDETIF